MRGTIALLCALVWCACGGDSSGGGGGIDAAVADDPDAAVIDPIDADGDGFPAGVDCNDFSDAAHPDAAELCDLLDNDCDGAVDEDAADAPTWYADVDGDGYGDDAVIEVSCSPPPGYSFYGGDCDDEDGAFHPGAFESCELDLDLNCDGRFGLVDGDGDGFFACEECDDTRAATNPAATEVCDGDDNDCDGEPDDGLAFRQHFPDADGDGFGELFGTPISACGPVDGFASNFIDCDDGDAAVHPGATESCVDDVDLNCDGRTGPEDNDGDGFAACEECNDNDPATNPAAEEVCDVFDADQDCDGELDEAPAGFTWYLDLDGDGFGDETAGTVTSCEPVDFRVTTPGDCDDADPAVNPGVEEPCEAVDLNCDGVLGDTDGDADGFQGCVDCDDGDPAINPDATEVCDDVDNDCDGEPDDGLPFQILAADTDGDGFGAFAGLIEACAPVDGFVANFIDCDDGDATIHPGALESCDAPVDLNCDGQAGPDDNDGDGFAACLECNDNDPEISPAGTEVCDELGFDEDCDGEFNEAAAGPTWYVDLDGDGFGDDTAGTITSCVQPAGRVTQPGDCDDADPAVNPGAAELCDAVDRDCDGVLGDADADADGFLACDDCDDGDPDVHPDAVEICNGLDEDCSGIADDGLGGDLWFLDGDGDGFGDPSQAIEACAQPVDFVDNADDCDDSDANIHPSATEVCDGFDDDCDGLIDDDDPSLTDAPTWFPDLDFDGFGDSSGPGIVQCADPGGFVQDGGDCDDQDQFFHPGAPEFCDDPSDFNCDGSSSFADADQDGAAACVDCDDEDPTSLPGADELCDGRDNDCDGTPDDGCVL